LKIISVNTGTVVPLLSISDQAGKQVMSAIHKKSVSSLSQPVPQGVGFYGVNGDEQANLEVHGGRDKAVYAYPFEHYGFWQDCLSREGVSKTPLEYGAFGENLTVEGLKEAEVYIGDQWRIANVLLEVVRFREPCFKFNIKMGWSGAVKAMIQSNTSGWYLRVLETGSIQAGDLIEVIPGKREISVLIQCSSFYSKSNQKDLWS